VLFAFVRSCAVEATYPVERANRTLADKIGYRIKAVFNASATSQENLRLKREVATLAMIAGDCQRLEEENARLRAALDYTRKTQGKWMAAEVLSQGGGAAGSKKTIRVGKGYFDGVKKGAAVAVPDGLVGRVTKTSAHTSEILLATDPSLKVGCAIDGVAGIRAISSGQSDDLLILKHFSAGAKVTPGAKVFTSGLGGVFPAGIPVGTLQGNLHQDATELLRECEVRPAVDFSTLEDVFIRCEE
jgi:rod shape-determining protein MreC